MIYNLRNIIDHDLGIKGEHYYVPLDLVTDTMNKLVELNEGQGLVTYYDSMQKELTGLSLKVSTKVLDVTKQDVKMKATTAITVPNAKDKALRIQGVPVALVGSTMYVHHDFIYVSLVLSSRLFFRLQLEDDSAKMSYKEASREVVDCMYTEVVRGLRLYEDMKELGKQGEDGLFDPVLSYPVRTFLDTEETTKYSIEGMTPDEIEKLRSGKDIIDLDEHIIVNEDDDEVFGFNVYHTSLSVLLTSEDKTPVLLTVENVPLNSDLILSDDMDVEYELPDDILYILDAEDSSREVIGEITVDMSPNGFSEMLFSTMPTKVYEELKDYLMMIRVLVSSSNDYKDTDLTVDYIDVPTALETFNKAMAEDNLDTPQNDDTEEL